MEALVLIGIAAGVVALIWYHSEEKTLKRRLKNAPTFSLHELPEAREARVIGQAQVLREHMRGPLSGRPCLGYIARVEQHRTNGRTSYWRTIISEARVVPFVLLDGTGRAIIDGAGAKLTLDFDSKSSSGTLDDPTEAERAFLARHRQQGKGLIFNKTLRYREAIIGVGETVAVLGTAVREPDPNAAPADYRGAQPTLVRLTSSPKYPLVICDDPATTRR